MKMMNAARVPVTLALTFLLCAPFAFAQTVALERGEQLRALRRVLVGNERVVAKPLDPAFCS